MNSKVNTTNLLLLYSILLIFLFCNWTLLQHIKGSLYFNVAVFLSFFTEKYLYCDTYCNGTVFFMYYLILLYNIKCFECWFSKIFVKRASLMVRKLLKNLLLHFSSEVQTLLLQHAVALCQNNLRLQLNKRELYKGYFFTCRRHSLYICFLRSFHWFAQ